MASNEHAFIYDSMTLRWLCGNTTIAAKGIENISKQTQVFKTGYEDPTYLTFKVEFGDWGWSVLPKSAITGFNAYNNGETVMSALKIAAQDYDQLPNGLLDMHYISQFSSTDPSSNVSTSRYTNYVFNSQNYYSAYNYLLMRNEDTRAEYLKAFVEGLWEIQHENPYMFLSISGLNTLLTFYPGAGLRLKDAQIDIECIEGLSLKIKTLLELYRKAAWDDIWQRWILPENMREFKMIIYVFERRVFHQSVLKEAIYNDVTGQRLSNNNNIMNTVSEKLASWLKAGKISASTYDTLYSKIHANQFSYNDINDDLPVYAFECNPCEFVIDNSVWDLALDATWDSDETKTVIHVNVKNVQTYYKNGMLDSKLSDIMVYDLLDAADRECVGGTVSINGYKLTGTITGAKMAYLNKNIFWQNDSVKDNRIAYGYDEVESVLGDSNYLNRLYGILGERGYSDQIGDSPAASLYLLREEANWWQDLVINQYTTSSITDLIKGFTWKKLGNLLNTLSATGTQMVRVSSAYANAAGLMYGNMLDFILYEGSPAYDTFSTAVDLARIPDHELFDNINDVVDGDYSWATYERGEWGDEHFDQEFALIPSDKLTGYDYSWATSDKKNPTDHKWKKTRGADPKPFVYSHINSKAMVGNDYSWATTDYDENGKVIGNNWDDPNLYANTEVVRTKNDFMWNGIDRDKLTNYDYSWATHDENNPRDHELTKQYNTMDPTERNSAIDNPNKDGEIDRDKLTGYDYSWATRDENNKNDHEMMDKLNTMDPTERNSALDSPVQGGDIDRDKLTNYDYSWATADDSLATDHKHGIYNSVDPSSNRYGILDRDNILVEMDPARQYDNDNLYGVSRDASIREHDLTGIDGDDRTWKFADSPIDPERDIHDMDPISMDPTQRTFDGKVVGGNIPRGDFLYDDDILLEINGPRELGDFTMILPSDPRNIDEQQLNAMDPTERGIGSDIYPLPYNPRDIDNDINIKMDDPRAILNNDLANVLQDERELAEIPLPDMDGERGIQMDINLPPYKERNLGDFKPIGLTVLDTEHTPMDIKAVPLEPRELPEFQNIREMEYREIPEYNERTIDYNPRTINGAITGVADYNERPLYDLQLKSLDGVERTTAEQLLRDVSQTERVLPDLVLNSVSKHERNVNIDISERNLNGVEREIKPQDLSSVKQEERELPKYDGSGSVSNEARELVDMRMYNLDKTERDLPDYNGSGNVSNEVRDIDDMYMHRIDDTARNLPDYNGSGNVSNDARKLDDMHLNNIDKTARKLDDMHLNTVDGNERNLLHDIKNGDISNKGRELKDVLMNRVQLVDIISKATYDNKLDADFATVDEETRDIELITRRLIGNSKAFKDMVSKGRELDDHKKDIEYVAQAFVMEEAALKKTFLKRISNLQEQLRQLTLDGVRQLPEYELNTLYDEKESLHIPEPILMSVDQVEQVKKNMVLIGISQESLRDMSYQALVGIHENIITELEHTTVLNGIERPMDRSMATDLDGGPKHKNTMRGLDDKTARKNKRKLLGHTIKK